jgi:hypothetical protein
MNITLSLQFIVTISVIIVIRFRFEARCSECYRAFIFQAFLLFQIQKMGHKTLDHLPIVFEYS